MKTNTRRTIDDSYFYWPAKRGNALMPWYLIMWRALPLSLALVFIFLAAVCIGIACGHKKAVSFWDDCH